MNWTRRFFSKIDGTLAAMLAVMAVGYVLIHDLLGGTLLAHSGWDSYTLQSLAWLSGSAALPENYSWLELAVYGGQYFVSFPPFPSVVLLPFALVFGMNTPNNLIVAVLCMCSAALAYRSMRLCHVRRNSAAIIALLCTWGTNLMWMSTNGGVWFMAQSLNMALLMAALHCAIRQRRVLSYALIACAVGCRPFSAFAFLPLFIYFYCLDRRTRGLGIVKTALLQAKCLIIPVLIAAAYMAYNYIRFDSVFEFGHNYLPEFTQSEHGQFSLTYVGENLYNLFIRPMKLTSWLGLDYPAFDGFMFYVANPFFILMFISAVSDAVHRRMDAVRVSLLAAMALTVLALCAHKTLGGWQFGARYTVDMIPLALGYMLHSRRDWRLKPYEKFIAAFGIMLNVYGALAMHFLNS